MSLNSQGMYPGAVLIWQVDIDPADQGTSIWQGSNLVSGAIGVGGPPRPGAPLTVKLYLFHDGTSNITQQRGLGRVAAAAATTQAATYPVLAGPAAYPAGGDACEIMVGEPVVLRTDALVVVPLRVCAIVVATMPGES